MAKYYFWIKELISVKADSNAITLLIDFGFRIHELTESEKTELLVLIGVNSYSIEAILNNIPVLKNSSNYIDDLQIKYILIEYVLANVITQEKANEIKTACGIS